MSVRVSKSGACVRLCLSACVCVCETDPSVQQTCQFNTPTPTKLIPANTRIIMKHTSNVTLIIHVYYQKITPAMIFYGQEIFGIKL